MNNSNAELHVVVLQMTVKKCTNPRDTAIVLLIKYFVCSRCRCRRCFRSLFTGENASGILTLKYFMMWTCICFHYSVTSCFMTSHWQQAMKMQTQGLVNCQLKTWKNCAVNREELKRKRKKIRKVNLKIEASISNAAFRKRISQMLYFLGGLFLLAATSVVKETKDSEKKADPFKEPPFESDALVRVSIMVTTFVLL